MTKIDFNKIVKSYGYTNTFIANGIKYHYSNMSLFECQMTHLISLFLSKVGVKTVLYDFDEETCISYCKSMINKNEKLIEFPIDLENNDYNLQNVYFALKKDIEKFKNYEELLCDLCTSYFVANLLNDSDKNVGYIYNNGNVSITPYYDFGSIFAIESAYGFGNYILDAYIDENARQEVCCDMNCSADEIEDDFNKALNIYAEKLKSVYFPFSDKIAEDCLPNVPSNLLDNIYNFDINNLINEDYHNYSSNSIKAISVIFETALNRIRPIIEKYRNMYKNEISISNSKK